MQTQDVGTRLLSARPVLTGSSDGSALENLIADSLGDGALCWVISEQAVYYFVKDSLAAVSAPDVIATGRGAGVPGRWFKFQEGTDCVPLQQTFYVSQSAPAGGDGSVCQPFNTLAAAVAAAPSLPVATTIWISPGDYSAEGNIEYTDKRLSVQGTQFFNQGGTTTPTHGVFLRPLSTGGVPMVLEVARTNCNIAARSQGILVLTEDAYVEALSDGVNLISWNFSGGDTLTARAGTQGTLANFITGTDMGISESISLNGYTLKNCAVNGALSMSTPTAFGSLEGCVIKFPLVSSATWVILDCSFPGDGSGVNIVITATLVQTDLATYERGVQVGVTWPLNTEIIDL